MSFTDVKYSDEDWVVVEDSLAGRLLPNVDITDLKLQMRLEVNSIMNFSCTNLWTDRPNYKDNMTKLEHMIEKHKWDYDAVKTEIKNLETIRDSQFRRGNETLQKNIIDEIQRIQEVDTIVRNQNKKTKDPKRQMVFDLCAHKWQYLTGLDPTVGVAGKGGPFYQFVKIITKPAFDNVTPPILRDYIASLK